MLLTDVKTDEMYKIIINTGLEIFKKYVLPEKSPGKHKIPRDRRALMRKISKLQKKIQRSTNHQTKENVLNHIKEIENNLKISLNTERNLRETRELLIAIPAIRAGIGPLQDDDGELATKQQKNERTTE